MICGCPAHLNRRGLLGAALAGPVLGAGPGEAAAPTRGRIDVHHHILPPQFLAEAPPSADQYRNNPKMAGWSLPRMLDELDRNGIELAVLSFPQPSQWSLEVEPQRRLARLCNDFFANILRDHPTRFGLFAGLPPLTDTAGALAEIEYAFGTLKADGVRVMTSYQTRWLGDEAFAPVMDELNRRAAVVFVHPDMAACCRNLIPGTAQGYEYPFDSARAAATLWSRGAFDRWPRIRWIFSHGSGALPMVAERLANSGRPPPGGKGQPLRDAFEQFRCLWVDTANASSAPSFAAAMELVGPSHILFGTDEPFVPIDRQIQQLRERRLAPRVLAGIERGNALSLIPSLAARLRS